jgi:hypothetical protein
LFNGFDAAFIGINIAAFAPRNYPGFSGVKMILTRFSTLYFLGFCYGKTFTGSFMRFNLWHKIITINKKTGENLISWFVTDLC